MHNKKGSEKFGVETIASGHLISLGKKTKEPGVQFEINHQDHVSVQALKNRSTEAPQ